MDLFYGTYLAYQVKQCVSESPDGLTIRQIEKAIHLYPTARERQNFRNRIRQCLHSMLYHGIVKREESRNESNLYFHKYSLDVQQD